MQQLGLSKITVLNSCIVKVDFSSAYPEFLGSEILVSGCAIADNLYNTKMAAAAVVQYNFLY